MKLENVKIEINDFLSCIEKLLIDKSYSDLIRITTILKNTFYKSFDGFLTDGDSVIICPIKKTGCETCL